MNKPSHLARHLLLLSVCLGLPLQAMSQDENLEMALKDQDRRIAGLNALAEKIKNFGFLGFAQKTLKKLEERERKEDPFGMAMDPEEALPEVAATDGAAGGEEVEEEQRTSLQGALQKFNVTGVFPARGEIIVGAQNLGVGDEVMIDYKGVAFQLEIISVASNEIRMRDTETGEEAGVQLGIVGELPAGMTRKRPPVSNEETTRQTDTIVPMSNKVVKVD